MRNIVLRDDDQGVHILGARQSGHPTVLNRNNSSAGSYGIELINADNVIIDSLGITGGYHGVFASDNSHSDYVTVQNSRIFDNAREEIWLNSSSDHATIDANEVFDSLNSAYSGIVLDGTDAVVTANVVHDNLRGIFVRGRQSQTIGNEVFDNATEGIYLDVDNDTQSMIVGNTVYGNTDGIYVSAYLSTWPALVRGNDVFDNSQRGIFLYQSGSAESNSVHGNAGTGIESRTSSTVIGNEVYSNSNGIELGWWSTSSTAESNRVYHNANVGIIAYVNSTANGNIVYANSVGIHGEKNVLDFGGNITNNLLYANTNQGVRITNATSGANVVNNTIYQPVGDAVRIETSSANVLLRNNILWIDSGYDIYVAPDSLSGFDSDYNLFHQGVDPNAFVGYWGSLDADVLADWQGTTGQDGTSLEGDPLFIDIDGADNIFGYDASGDGFDGGRDDNFILRKDSPAIDRAYSWWAPRTDLQGSPRRDDLGTTNQGSPEYFATTIANSVYDPLVPGTAQNWHGDNARWTYNLPFTFPFYGTDYGSVEVTSNGLLQFATTTNATDAANSTSKLYSMIRIAPLWDDSRTDNAGDDIFIDTSQTDRVTIRWDATNKADQSDVNVAVTLVDTGEIQFHYGEGNGNPTPTVGISSGQGRGYQLHTYDGATDLANATSIAFTLGDGVVDVGAYEFLGDSGDVDPPVVVGTLPNPIHLQGTSTGNITSIELQFSEEVNNIDANAPAAYDLRNSGSNGVFGDGDDEVFTVVPSYIPGDTAATLDIVEGILPLGDYRLTLFSRTSRSVHDTAGLRLDGDANGSEGETMCDTSKSVKTRWKETTTEMATWTTTITSSGRPTLARLRAPACKPMATEMALWMPRTTPSGEIM